jgi:DNA-binding response OmpR family regulator
MGADDYMVKPFSPRQLVARIRAVLRRVGLSAASEIYQIGKLRYSPGKREVIVGDGDVVTLSALENRLFEYLIVNAGQVLTVEAMIDHIWGAGGADRDMLRQLVHRVRSKIEPDAANPIYITTVSGLGYGFIKDRES